MKKNIIILSLLIPFSGYCQNLVNNSSFESFNTCPPQIGLGFTTYISYADNWDYYQLTPDYFNSCSAGNASVPNNYLGTQTASTGIAYAGFSAFQDIFVNNAREGILVKLSDTLQVGVKYYCSFKINLADSSVWACNKVGMLFHTKYTQEQFSFQANLSQVYASLIVSDTANWITISDTFVADSNYIYLSITNHFNDNNTSITRMKNGLGFAYYYIDDICVSSDSNTCAMLTTNIQLDQNPTTFSKMFPNPCTSSTTLWTDKSLINATLTVYNSYGQKVKQIDHLSGQTIIFHRDNLTSGLYFIRLTQNSKTFSVDKFVITDN